MLKGHSKIVLRIAFIVISNLLTENLFCYQDSIFQEIVKLPISQQRADSLNDYAWDVVNRDIDLFKLCGNLALKDSRTTDYLFGQCEALQILGSYQYYVGALDSALVYYAIALEKRIEFGDSALVSGTLNNIANVHKAEGKYFLALEKYDLANGYCPASDIQRQARLMTNIGSIYTMIGDYQTAFKYHSQACELLIESENPADYAYCQLNMANVHEKASDFAKALELYNTAALTFERMGVPLQYAKAQNNIGNIYLKQGQLGRAIEVYQNAHDIYEGAGSLPEKAGVEQNLGLAFKSKGDFSASKSFFESSRETWSEVGNDFKIAEVLINIGNLYLNTKEFQKARNAYQEAQPLLPEESPLSADLYYGLSLALASLGEHQEAFPYQLKYSQSKEEQELQQIKFRNLDAQYREDQNKIRLLEKDAKIAEERQKKLEVQRYSFIIIGILMAMIFTVLYANWQIKKKRLLADQAALEKQQQVEQLLKNQELVSIRKVLEGQDKERKRIAQDLHDHLGSLLSMVKLHFQKVIDSFSEPSIHLEEDYKKANVLIDTACDEVRNIARNLSSGVLKNFGLAAAIQDLKGSLCNTGQYEVELVIHEFETRLPFNIEINIYRVVQELISNIMRHANANEISIQLIRKVNNLHISVEDNGQGFEKMENLNKNGMGFKNIESRLHELSGTINIDSGIGRGTSVFIDIPINDFL